MNAHSRAEPDRIINEGAGRRVLFTAVKNEAPFLLEWIAYHQVIGFDTIIVASNDCEDGTDDLLTALAEAGEITHLCHSVPVGKRPQGNAARLVNDAGLLRPGDWVMWLDADEFLNIHVGNGRLEDLLAAVAPYDGALFNWRIFGDGGNERFPGRFISDAFTGASRPTFRKNQEIKTLFRMGPGIEGLGIHGINRPKLAPGRGATPHRFLAPSGDPIRSDAKINQRWLSGEDTPKHGKALKAEHGYALAQINHYLVRTPEFFRLKQRRGRGWARRPEDGVNDRHTEAFYEQSNRNDVEDRSILRFEAAVGEQMEVLRTLPGVYEAEVVIERRVRENLDELFADAAPTEPVAAPAEELFELTLPGPAADMLRAHYAKADVVLEYGSGGSSFEAMKLGVRRLFTVESDADWASRIAASLATQFPRAEAHVHHADIGPTKAWGRPRGSAAAALFPDYALSVWERPDFEPPDVVLIDGRFRVACFLTVMVLTPKPVTVLFDDYHKRPAYHWIEDLVAPVDRARRMAKFEVTPGMIPPAQFARAVRAFVDPD